VTRLRPGDVIEIPTTIGFAYALYTHKNALMGTLLRVLPGVYEERPQEFDSLITAPDRFLVFYPLVRGIKLGLVSVATHADVPPQKKSFPVFRTGVPVDGQIEDWWLWDGDDDLYVGAWRDDLEQYPMRHGIVSDPLLKAWVVSGAPTEHDVRGQGKPLDLAREFEDTDTSLVHFFYFKEKHDGVLAAAVLETTGFATNVADIDDAWRVRATERSSRGSEPEANRRLLETIASEHRGEYDGWELALGSE
jgi:hypothetical protein